MAAFHEVQFPTDISRGAQGGPGFHTTILTLAGGAEQRNVDWSRARATYDVAKGLKDTADIAALIKFHYARYGRAYGFRYKDWSDYTLPFWLDSPGDIDALPTLFTTDGTTATFQLTKVYGDGANTYTRQIKKPVAGTLALKDNGAPLTPTTDFTFSTTTGIVTLSNAVKASTGHLITGSCQFDVPVRFDTDDLRLQIDDFDIYSMPQIMLVELKL